MNEEDDLLSVSEVALMFNFSERYVRDLLNNGKLTGGRAREKGKWLVKRGEVKRYIKAMGFGDEPQSEQEHKSEADVGTKVTHASTEDKDDPQLIEARKQHINEIREIGWQFVSYLDTFPSLSAKHGSIDDYFDTKGQIEAKEGRVTSNPLFEYLKQHIPNDYLWKSYEHLTYAQFLCDEFSDLILDEHSLQEIKEDFLNREIWKNTDGYDEYYNGIIQSIDWELPSPMKSLRKLLLDLLPLTRRIRDSLVAELSRGLYRTKCSACPIDAITESPD